MTPIQRLDRYKGELLGNAEFAEVLDISKQALRNRRSRGRLPKPVVNLAMGPVWRKADIREFVAAYSILSPRNAK